MKLTSRASMIQSDFFGFYGHTCSSDAIPCPFCLLRLSQFVATSFFFRLKIFFETAGHCEVQGGDWSERLGLSGGVVWFEFEDMINIRVKTVSMMCYITYLWTLT